MNVNKVKTVAFISVFCALFAFASWFFRPPQNNTSILYYENTNSIDVLFVGSSQIFCNINPNVIWREEGIAAFNYASNSQPAWTSYYFIREALKKQKPQLIILDVYMVADKLDGDYDPPVRQIVYSTFPQSINRWQMIEAGSIPEQRISLMIDFLQYHTRWRDIRNKSLPYAKLDYMRENHFRYKGYWQDYIIGTTSCSPELNEVIYPVTNEIGELPEKNLKYLLKIIEYTKNKNIPLILIKTPTETILNNKLTQKEYNKIDEIAMQNGIPFYDYHKKEYRDEIGIDFTTDFFDSTHLNALGAAKFSKYIAGYLKENYDLPDRRGEPEYKSWDESADGYFRLETIEAAKEKTDLPSYLEAIKDASKNLIFITSVNGGISESIEPLKEQLPIFGIRSDIIGKNSYIGIYEPSSSYQYEDISATRKLRKNIYKDNVPINVEVISAGNEVGNIASIKIDGKEQAKNKRGLNVVIYDKEMERVFDSFYVDPFLNENEALAIKR